MNEDHYKKALTSMFDFVPSFNFDLDKKEPKEIYTINAELRFCELVAMLERSDLESLKGKPPKINSEIGYFFGHILPYSICFEGSIYFKGHIDSQHYDFLKRLNSKFREKDREAFEIYKEKGKGKEYESAIQEENNILIGLSDKARKLSQPNYLEILLRANKKYCGLEAEEAYQWIIWRQLMRFGLGSGNDLNSATPKNFNETRKKYDLVDIECKTEKARQTWEALKDVPLGFMEKLDIEGTYNAGRKSFSLIKDYRENKVFGNYNVIHDPEKGLWIKDCDFVPIKLSLLDVTPEEINLLTP
jgi:hypothetical protein